MTDSKRRSSEAKPTKANPKAAKSRRKPTGVNPVRAKLSPRVVRRRGSVLERVVDLIGDVGIVVTASTKWKDIGFDDDSLDMFCRVQVSDEFGKPFEGADAGSKVGDLVASINRALGD